MANNRLAWLKDALWVIVFAGTVAVILRFALGLGYTTGLNDVTPWGLWIAFKLGFVALAGGGFTLAAMVYIFHLESYRPLIRRAILLALLGYGSFIVSLIFDLGLPWHIYMPILHWQHHSVMFEVAWCVILYFSVLLMEFGPVGLEHAWFQKPIFQFFRGLLHKAVIPLVIAGIVLSTLHQSSLGALFLIMPHRVHPLWYSPLIPVLFFTSAIGVGLAALILEGFFCRFFLGQPLQMHLLSRLGKSSAFVLSIYLVVRIGDLAWRGVLPSALDGSWQSWLFILEILVGGGIPVVLLSISRFRLRPEGLFTAALLMVMGVLSQRMALSLFTMWRPAGTSYTPSGLEILIAIAIPAAAGIIYLTFSQNLALFRAGEIAWASAPILVSQLSPTGATSRRDNPVTAVARRSGLAILVIATVFAFLPERTLARQPARDITAQAARGWHTMRINSDGQGVGVNFPHEEHQERMQELYGEAMACRVCHHLSMPGDEETACWECHQSVYTTTPIFDHVFHVKSLGGNQSCEECHTGEHTRSNAAECEQCHQPVESVMGESALVSIAPAYMDAMHGSCLECHKEQTSQSGKEELALCSVCHRAAPNESKELKANIFMEGDNE